MLIVGERLNSSRASVARALRQRDAAFVQDEARKQVAAGASYLSVNAAALLGEETGHLLWLVDTVQAAVDCPLCLDSPDPSAIAAAVARHQGRTLLNSITGEKHKYDRLLPLIAEHKPRVVALCLDDAGTPATAQGRADIASRLIEGLTGQGLALEDIFIDPLVYPISVDGNAAQVVLDALELIAERYPGVNTICGLSNVSFGLPARHLLRRTFLAMAMSRGLSAAILDPCEEGIMSAIVAAEALLGKDSYCGGYIAAHRQGKLD